MPCNQSPVSKLYTVFVYGTLLNRDVRDAIIGRSTTTYSDVLEGYKKVGLNIVEEPKSEVDGVYFEVTAEELERLDKYEGVATGLYKRVDVTLASGDEAIVYQKCNPGQVIFAGSVVG